MAMVTKKVMAKDGNTTDNGYSKEGGGHWRAATMAMGMGTAQRTRPLMLQLERGG
jgi:hypothetical protein